MLCTTLNLLKTAGTFDERYEVFLRQKGDDGEQVALVEIIDFSRNMQHPLDNPILLLRCCTNSDKARCVSKMLALNCAEHVEHCFSQRYPQDLRVRNSNAVVGRYLAGDASKEEVMAAGFAAWTAARDVALRTFPTVADVAWAAAAASVDAFYTAMRNDAEDAGWAAWATAEVAVDAAGDAERVWQMERFKELVARY